MMYSSCFKMRTFGVGGNHEIILPNGKVILVDPYFIDCNFPGFTRDNVTGADYIILTHGHFDHDSDLGYLCKKFGAKVFCGALTANELVKYHRIPYDSLFPVFPGGKYTMEGVTLEFWQAKHNESIGRTYDPDEDLCKTLYGFEDHRDIEDHREMDNLGSFESLDWMLTTDNGFRIMMCSGRPLFRETFDRCRVLRPNVLLRQAGLRRQEKSGGQISALELAKLLVQYGAQLIFPFHFDVIIKKWGHEKTGEYMDEVARHVRELDPGALFVFPEALKWYSVDLRVTAES